MTRLKKIMLVVCVVLIGASTYAYYFLKDIGAMASGMASHTLCTNVLMIGREKTDVEENDLNAPQREMTISVINHALNRVDTDFHIGPLTFSNASIYRPGLGCYMLQGQDVAKTSKIKIEGKVPVEISGVTSNWPKVDSNVENVDYTKLHGAVDYAFAEETEDVDEAKSTRAVVVYQGGKLIAERYAKGFTGETPLRAMSMTKSVTSALAGILVGKGDMKIDDPTGIIGLKETQGPITINHILKMTSGFAYREEMETNPRSVLQLMMFVEPDGAAYAAGLEFDKKPGSYWDYQTANPVLLQKIIRNHSKDDQAYYRTAHEELFDKAGMTNAFFQADASGTYAGGALMYASARDWMRFGLMYLNDGVVDGVRVLPEGWVDYTRTPSKASLNRRAYGAQFWLNAKSKDHWMRELPQDLYAAQGHYGQYVVIIPSLDLVIVRMGMTFKSGAFDLEYFLEGVVGAINHTE